jgi:hypothetical protein
LSSFPPPAAQPAASRAAAATRIRIVRVRRTAGTSSDDSHQKNLPGWAAVPVCQPTRSRSTLLVAMTAQATGNLAP